MPDRSHVYAKGMRGVLVPRAPDFAQDEGVGEHAPGVVGEEGEELVLDRREADLPTLELDWKVARRSLRDERVDCQGPASVREVLVAPDGGDSEPFAGRVLHVLIFLCARSA